MKPINIFLIIIVVLGVVWFFYQKNNQFDIPKGETVPFEEVVEEVAEKTIEKESSKEEIKQKIDTDINVAINNKEIVMAKSQRQIFITDKVKHSIPLDEILSGGPPKDGIPSIDNPQFILPKEADEFLTNDSIGLGVVSGSDVKFYPYQILVWHEIVNDNTGERPLLVTYCPLCATGVVFDPVIDGNVSEFGVSGKLWQSNLLMYNRADSENKESLWSQVLGEAVLGEFTGIKLKVLPSDTVRYGDWKKKHKDTKVLSKDTGAQRAYGSDPYGNYYTSESVSFGATFDDDRLHPKTLVLGVEVNGKFKAYHKDILGEGETKDEFAGENIVITKDEFGSVRMFVGEERKPLSYIGGFWFSWLAVHPETELYK